MPKPSAFWSPLFLVAFVAGCGASSGDVPSSDEDLRESTAAIASDLQCHKARYLALGDSITFGDNGFIPYAPQTRPNDDAFVGFADDVGKSLYRGRYYNLGCPGETTGAFLDATAEDNGCRYIRANLPDSLHYAYGTRTQLDEALFLLARNREVKAITLTLGGNDLLIVQRNCVSATPTDPVAIGACLSVEAPKAIQAAAGNLARIAGTLRSKGKFKGKIAFVNNYATNYADPVTVPFLAGYNAAAAQALASFDVTIVDAFGAIAAAAGPSGDACAAGLLVPNPVQPPPAGQPACDIHPSPAGRAVLAAAVSDALR